MEITTTNSFKALKEVGTERSASMIFTSIAKPFNADSIMDGSNDAVWEWGMRDLILASIWLSDRSLIVVAVGGKYRTCPYARSTSEAWDRHLQSTDLFEAKVAQMLRFRSRSARALWGSEWLDWVDTAQHRRKYRCKHRHRSGGSSGRRILCWYVGYMIETPGRSLERWTAARCIASLRPRGDTADQYRTLGSW